MGSRSDDHHSAEQHGSDPATKGSEAMPKGGCCGHHGHGHHHHGRKANLPEATATTDPAPHQAIDPVCGMKVTIRPDAHQASHAGETYYFCNPRCREKFLADPARYLSPKPETESAPAPKGTIWTCPMHPEIKSDQPGACPLCGMALEPMAPTSDSGPNPEFLDMRRRLAVGTLLVLPILILDMGHHWLGLTFGLPGWVSAWLQFLLATPIVFWAGFPFFERFWLSLRHRHPNMFTLIAMGTGVAWAYSAIAVLFPALFPPAFRMADGSIALYFEAASVITILVLVGQVLELKARERTGQALRALLDLSPKSARRIGADGDEEIPAAAIRIGDLLRIRPGEQIPVDGEAIEGKASLDESLVTGESLPIEKGPDDALIAGTLNRDGVLIMRATVIGENTMLARIQRLVAEAQRSRAPIQSLADTVSSYFVPGVMLVAVLAFLGWALFGPAPAMGSGLVAAVSVLIIACPCALGLATPMSIMMGIGRGAASGILIRNAEALERMEAVDTIVLDKTGTLTEGKPAVVAIESFGAHGADAILQMAAGLERTSEHPLATAILREAKARHLALGEPDNVRATIGRGIAGKIAGHEIAIGQEAFLKSADLAVTPAMNAAGDRHRQDGASVIFIAIDGEIAGLIAIADPIKPTTQSAIADLTRAGLRILMLTGDHPATAMSVARRLGIGEVEAECLPEKKSAIITRLKSEGRVIAMVGDGVNDAPALALADIGIAMGHGADVAIESAGITLLGGDLNGLLAAKKLSRSVMRNIRQNLVFAFAYNAAGIPIAAGLFYPIFGLLLSPVFAAAAMALSSVSVIGNALRLRLLRL